MVRIEEVQDESEKIRQEGLAAGLHDEDEWEEASDSESEDDLSDDEDDVDERALVIANETIWDRICALKDIISPSTRATIAKTWNTTTAYGYAGGWVAGKLIWIGVTSALLVGLPFALAVEDESRIAAQEKDMIAQQQGANGTAQGNNPLAPPAAVSGQSQGLRPPGF
ncbi:mitochondrial import receptor subunit Tom22 [Malassezia pachydermatis]|uniref:Mitochondrial import receptor subunit tom22 n=1 Tax=Malassezia pachydermatis TaxID=77020 RepID=A0A0M9VQN9_9BASI|nr:mitochondrial import receptor subunit tom22 [Malassezia pachydermatis]KOS15735.1 mitochondrial import receptor subunit tom22 [Malassezia pachydermatis]